MTEVNPVQRNINQPNFFSFLRILTGMVIIYKSVNFIQDTVQAKSLIEQTGIGVFSQNSQALASVLIYLGLLCGLFITIGLFTRISAIIQIPVILIAVFFVNSKHISDNLFEFILSMLVLLLLILFTLKGSGFFSADEYFRKGATLDEKLRRRSSV